MGTYTSRPKQRSARKAWDYFAKRYPPGVRTVELFYTPNYRGDGPGWVWDLGRLKTDTLHWHGADDISKGVLVSNLRNPA